MWEFWSTEVQLDCIERGSGGGGDPGGLSVAGQGRGSGDGITSCRLEVSGFSGSVKRAVENWSEQIGGPSVAESRKRYKGASLLDRGLGAGRTGRWNSTDRPVWQDRAYSRF